ncbi:hypothetical protein HanRHA438_Chr06g0258811 [Helianthus annuus]|nr:hypothetical protein HanRHA438_Chr06g0258811 [Helianthus annuus]
MRTSYNKRLNVHFHHMFVNLNVCFMRTSYNKTSYIPFITCLSIVIFLFNIIVSDRLFFMILRLERTFITCLSIVTCI